MTIFKRKTWLQQYMEVSGQLQAPAALSPVEERPVLIP
jgi:hypothetical protein